jgi:hypothetical protein
MRRVIDMLIVLMLVAVLVGLVWHYRGEQKELEDYRAVHDAISRLYEQALSQGSLAEPTTKAGFPLMIHERWFRGDLPVNVAVDAGQPWLDIAPLGDMSDQPPDPVITTADQAGIWYNPNRGLFRARVMPQFTDEETLTLYNQLNNTALKLLPRDAKPERQPVSIAKIAAAADQVIADDASGKVTSPALRRRSLSDVKTRK